MDQKSKGVLFYDLHHRDHPFVIPNPWDIGSARMFAARGFEALATTSAGVDHVSGHPEGTAGREMILANATQIAGATDLPVSVDLEDCYGADAAGITDTIRMAADAGAVGGSIEDARYGGGGMLYSIQEAAVRVSSAAEAAAALPFKFTLTARAEGLLYGNSDMDDIVRRLNMFAEAGADVLYAPGLKTVEQVEAVVKAVDKPVNVLLGLGGTTMSMADMHRLGVARVSLGSALHRAAITAALSALDEIRDSGTFSFTDTLPPADEIDALLR